MKRKNRIAGVALATASALALAAYAIAADSTAGQTYTGCLKNGKLDSLAIGTSPVAPCAGGATQVQLGNGDVTAVSAGPGLSGGGDGGDITLAADTSILQARVVGSCLGTRVNPGDASISAIHADGSVTCNPDDAGGGAEVIAGYADGPGYLPWGDTLGPVRQLALPKGRYAIVATLDVDSGLNLGRTEARCELRAGGDFDQSDIDLAGALGGAPLSERITLEVVHEFPEAGAAVLSCRSDGAQGPGRWLFLKITALRVSSLSNAPLASP
jgi:hypothetical protein